jgi:hypothetical protein
MQDYAMHLSMHLGHEKCDEMLSNPIFPTNPLQPPPMTASMSVQDFVPRVGNSADWIVQEQSASPMETD